MWQPEAGKTMNLDDNSIPLLTEIIPAAPVPLASGAIDYAASMPGAFQSAPAAAGYQAPASAAPLHTGVAPDAPVTPAAEQYRQWEQEIRENVLHTLLEQADTVVQQHLQDQLALAMDNMTTILTQRIKDSLHQALADTVTRAVAEEMARFASSKK